MQKFFFFKKIARNYEIAIHGFLLAPDYPVRRSWAALLPGRPPLPIFRGSGAKSKRRSREDHFGGWFASRLTGFDRRRVAAGVKLRRRLAGVGVRELERH